MQNKYLGLCIYTVFNQQTGNIIYPNDFWKLSGENRMFTLN